MLVDQRQDAQGPPIVRLGLYEVEAPDVVTVKRTQPFARAVVQPEAAAGSLSAGDLQPLATPDTLNPVLAHLPARCPQQRGDAAVAIAPVLGRQSDDGAALPVRRDDAGRADLEVRGSDDARRALRGRARAADRLTRPVVRAEGVGGVATRRGMQKALVAVARKLAIVLHRMWRDGTDVRWSAAATTEA